MSWALTFVGIILLIVLHELGHFAVAKWVGMRVERFSLFFPPRLFGVKRGETDYCVGLIPAGGYVKITGMNPDEIKDLEPEVAKRAYYAQAPWRRIVVILAGPGMNLLIALFLFWVVLVSGDASGAKTLENLNPSVQTVRPVTTVEAIEKGTPAASALRLGDRIIAVNGAPATVNTVERAVKGDRCAGELADGCGGAAPLRITLRRDGQTVTVVTHPRYNAEDKRMRIGFAFGVTPKAYGPLAAVGMAGREMAQTASTLVTNLGHAFTSAKARHEISSIVGITEVTQEAVTRGWAYAFVVLGLVSLALAVINMFPFLPLDGGHVLWALAEKVRGRRVSINAMWRFSSVGIVLLLFLVFNGFYNDLSRLGA